MRHMMTKPNSQLYPLNEIFYSLQGEAYFAGQPAVFIRLQGCSVGCPFCDTKHTWKLNSSAQVSSVAIRDKISDSNSWAYFSTAEILAAIAAYPAAKHIVFTGGEPADYNLIELTQTLNDLGYSTQIETSGTAALYVSPATWVTLSPKIDMPNHKQVLSTVVQRANEIKMPIGKAQDIDKLKLFLQAHPQATQLIWLQPLSCKTTPTELCLRAALAHNWRLSLQIHKFIAIR